MWTTAACRRTQDSFAPDALRCGEVRGAARHRNTKRPV